MEYNTITPRHIIRLAKQRSDPAISIYVPTARTGADVLLGRIKLKNLLTKAENELVQRGMRHTLALDFLSRACELDQSEDFWNTRLDCIAMFIGPDIFEAFHLPFSAPEYVEVGTRFHVRPLLPVLESCFSYYVLALERDDIRLVHYTARKAKKEHVENMPKSFKAFVGVTHPGKQLEYHSAGRIGRAGTVIRHSGGDQSAEDKDRLHHLCLAVNRSVEAHLAASTDPVILAGTKDFQDCFREVSTLPNLAAKGIEGSPKMLGLGELHDAAEPIIRDLEAEQRAHRLARFSELGGTDLACHELYDILAAAWFGKVDTLFIRDGAQVWGTFVPGASMVTHETPIDGDEDLLNKAAIATLESSGVAYIVAPDEKTFVGPAVAILRY